MNDKRDQLYDNLINSGRVSEDEIGNREQFKAAIRDEAASRQFYNNIINSGLLTADEIGNEDDFYNSISSDFAAPAPQGYKPSSEDMAGFMGTINKAGKVASGSLQSFDRRTQNLQKRQGLNVPQRVNVGESNNLVQGDQRFNPETGELENTYITSSGNEYDNKALADMEQRQRDQFDRDQRYMQSVPGQLEQAYAERDRLNQMAEARRKQIEEEKSNEGFMTRFIREAGRAAQSDKLPDNLSPSADWENDREYSNIMAAIRKNNELITTLEDQRDNATNGFWHSFGNEIANGYTFSLGGKAKMDDMIALSEAQKHIDSINKKRSNGEQLTHEEEIAEAVLKNNEWDREIQGRYGDDYGAWARAGKMGANSADFMLDFLMMGGMPAGMAKNIMGAVVKGGEKYLGSMATKGFGRFMLKATGATLGSMVAGAEITNTIQLGKTGSDMAKSMMGDVYRDENGNYVFGHYEEDENGNPKFVEGGNDFFEALAEVQRKGISENGSEIIGSFLPGGGKALSSAGGQLLEKLGLSKISTGLTALTGKKWFQTYNKFLETAGFNGVVGEGLEEYAGTALDWMMGGDEWKNLADPRTHVDIWLGVSTMSGILNAPNLIGTGYSAMQYQRYKQATNKADADASATMDPETWNSLRETIDNTDNANMADVSMGILNNEDLSDEAKRAAMNYIGSLQKMRGYSLGSIAAGKEEGGESEASRMVDESYTEGYNTQEPDLMKQFNDEAQQSAAVLPKYGEEFAKMIVESQDPVSTMNDLMNKRDIYTDEQIAAAADYYQKMSRVNGAMDGALGRIDLEVEKANAEVRGNTHQQTGNVVFAKGADNLDYYIVGGDIVTDPETGLTSLTGTGGAVVVKDLLGNVSVKSPQDLKIYSIQPSEELININETDLRQRLMQQADNDMTYGSPANEVYQLEDTVTLQDGEGNIIEGEIGMMPNAQDGVYVVYTPDNKAMQFTADELNRMIVTHNGQEVQRTSPQQAENGSNSQLNSENPTENAENGQNYAQNQPENIQSGNLDNTGGEASTENGTGADNPPVSALSRIPVLQDEKGKPVLNRKGKPQYLWHKASVEDAAAALIETTGGDMVMARDTASDLVKNAQAGLEKIRKQKPKGDDPIEIAESRMEIKRQEQDQQAIIKQWMDVNQAIQKQMRDVAAARQAEIEAAKSEEQRKREAAEAEERKKKQDEIDRQRIREQIEKDKERRNKEYSPLVKAREEMADDADALAILGDTEPRSLDEWVSSLLRPHSLLWQDASPTEVGLQSELGLKRADMNRFMSLIGNKESNAQPFGKAVLDIYESLPEGIKNQYTDEDVRNTLLDLFNEGSSTRMLHLTEEHRIEEAREIVQENLRREAEYQLEQWAEAYHLTPEEREAFEDYLAQAPSEPEQEIINNIIADNEYKQSEASREEDQQSDSRADVSGSERGESQVLNETEATNNGTDETGTTQAAEGTTGESSVSDDTVSGEGSVIPTPKVDIPRFKKIRRNLADAYSAAVDTGGRNPEDLQAINDAAREVLKYVDEGLDDYREYEDDIEDYEGDDPEKLADQYITRVYHDRYADDDADEQYIRTGLKPDMRQRNNFISYKGKKFEANDCGICTNPNKIENRGKNYIGYEIRTALSDKGWVGSCSVDGPTYGWGSGVSAGWYDNYFKTEKECQTYWAERSLDYLKQQKDPRMKKYEVALQAIIDKSGKKPTPIKPSEQLKPIDLRDATRVESPEIGVNEANAKAREAAGIQPVGNGDFGPIYDQFRGKPKEAIDFLTSIQEGEALGALSHKDIGEIDLVWGEEGTGHSDGYGLAKLVKYHPEVLENLQEILDEMEVVKRTDNRINLESDKYKAAVRLTWNKQSKTWLLTVFEKKNSALDNTTDTGKTSDRGKRNDTATPQSTVSEDKDTNNSANIQENKEESLQKPQNSVKRPGTNTPEGEILAKGGTKLYTNDGNIIYIVGSNIDKAKGERFYTCTLYENDDNFKNGIPVTKFTIAQQDMRNNLNNGTYSKKQPIKQEPQKKEPKRLVSDEKMEELRKKLLDKLNNLNAGIDPEMMLLGAMYAVGNIERGVTKFADYAKAMIEGLNDKIRPYLKSFYNAVRDMPEAAEYASQMDDYDTVARFDVYNFDKQQTPDAITKAEQVVKEQKIRKQAKKIKQQQPDLFSGDLFATQEEPQQAPQPKNEPRLRPAVEADLDEQNPVVYYQGKPVHIMAIMRQGEQVGAGQFSKPTIGSIMLTNGKSVKLEDLMVEDTSAIGETSSPAQIAAEEAKVDTNPTEAQKEAGNYQKGHIKVDGYDITIENPKGSIRRGIDASGKPWETEMHNTYGYIRGTEGIDGDHIDVFLSDNPTSGSVYVVDQVNPSTGDFDEHKCMYGFGSEEEAREAYLSNYSKGWKGLGNITEVSREDFKKWIDSSHRKTKPFAEYKIAQKQKPRTPWWNDPNRPQSIDPSDYKTYMTDEAKEYFANYVSQPDENGKITDFTKWAHPNLAYITAAVWDEVEIPYEDLKNVPEIAEAENTIKNAEAKGKLEISEEEANRLAQRLIDSAEARQERKALVIIGLPAGGKSSVFANPLSKQYGARIIDSDDVKPWLEGFDGGNGAGYVQDASAEVAEKAIDIAVKNGDNIIIPRIGGKSVIDLSAALRLAGYDVQLYFNDVKGVTSIDRAASRFAQTGRYLSLDYLTKKAGVPSENFSKFAEKTIGGYLDERSKKEVQDIRRRVQGLRGELYGSGSGLWESLTAKREGTGEAEGAVQADLGSRGLQTGSNDLSVLLASPLFNYSEWKSNDVPIGQKPKEIWNSESGKPMPTNERINNETERKVSAEPESAGEGTGQTSGSAGRAGAERSPEQDRVERSGSGYSVETPRTVPDGGEARDSSERPAANSTGIITRGTTSALPKHNNRRNNVGERGKDYAPLSPKARFNANVEAIKLMRLLNDEGIEAPAQDQMEVLRKYSGWGGMGTFFNDATTAEYRELRDLLSEEEYNDAAMSINSAYYTPAMVIDSLWDIAKAMGFKGGNVLEGSAGIGNIIGQMPKDMSSRSDIEAVEIDAISGNILKLLYPDAKVHIQGFQDTVIPNGTVDLAITNVPFVTGLHVIDKVDKDLSRKFTNIHDFCIAKNIRKLREGGIGLFITSAGTMDKSTKLREWITDEGQADVVGAFRMNNKTFGGTTVTSDIIVVRKRTNGQKSPVAIDITQASPLRVGSYEDKWGDKHQVSMVVNDYFRDNPDMMAGEMAFGYEKGDTFRPGSYGLYPVEGKDQTKMLADFAKSMSKAKEVAAPKQQTETEPNQLTVEKEGRMLVDDKGRLCVSTRGIAVPLGLNDQKVKGYTKQECFGDYQAVQKAVDDVLQQQLNDPDDAALQPKLDALNKAYDKFTKRYGTLHKNTAISFLRNDIDFPSFQALENYSETKDMKGKVTVKTAKTPLFKQRVLGFKTEPKPKSVKDALIASIFRTNGIDLKWITEKLNEAGVKPPHKDQWNEEDVRKGILVSRLGFENPSTGQLEIRYKYLSGNVREKLAIAEGYNTDGSYSANVEELRKAVPMDIPSHLIDFSLGSSWIPVELYTDYLKEYYSLNNAKLNHIEGSWVLDEGFSFRNEKNRAAGVYSEKFRETIYGHQLVAAALNNRPVKVSKQVSEGWGDNKTTKTVVDQAATNACAVRVDEIKDEFKQYAKKRMQEDPELAQRIEKIYNDKFNALVPMQIDDEFLPDKFEGANMNISLYEHQKRGVMRGLTAPTMLAHEVGTGKSFTLISTAMEMRRLGTAKKPMIVVQNATVAQLTSDAKLLYPNAKVLSLSEKDRSAEGRRAFYAKIKYNDWDLIIVPQSTFERIPDSPERELQFIQEKIDEKKHIIEAAEAAGMDTRELNRLKKELEKIEQEYGDTYLDHDPANLDKSKETTKKKKKDAKKEAASLDKAETKAKEMLDRAVDDVQYFDDLGVDALLVDEAHEYKHLGFQTSIGRGIKGIDPSYSKKCAGLYNKTRSVFEKAGWKNVVFATGTPISNTAAEIWTFMKYLMQPDVMKANDIYYFDDFVHNFGNISQMLEFSTSGKFKENTRFAAYVNKPELIRIWSQVADTVLTKEVGEVKSRVPEKEGGKDQDVFLPQSPSLISIMAAVRAELERFENMDGKEKKENSHIPLTMYGVAKRAAIDPRLVNPDAPDEPLSKTNAAVKEIVKDLNATKSYKGTVAVFCDNQNRKDENGNIDFNIYEDMREKLIAQGVPADQIAIVKSGMSITAKQKIFDAVNTGAIRVVLGSTQTLGTGVNMQERLHLLIHMDAPDRPMDYTQRNGRIERQGNLHKTWDKPIRIVRFGVEDSLDVTAYQRLKTKSGFIDSIMDGKTALMNNQVDRTVEEEEEGLFDNPVAVLSGSQYALKKNQAERELRKYQGKKAQWEADQVYITNTLRYYKGVVSSTKDDIEDEEKKLAKIKGMFPDGKVKTITVDGTKIDMTKPDAEKKLSEAIKEKISDPSNAMVKKLREDQFYDDQTLEYTIELDGHPVTFTVSVFRTNQWDGSKMKTVVHKTTSNSSKDLMIEPWIGNSKSVKDQLDEILSDMVTGRDSQDRIDAMRAKIDRINAESEQLRQREGQPFQYDKELAEAKKNVEEYTELMKQEMKEKEAKYAEQQKEAEANGNTFDLNKAEDNSEEDDDVLRRSDDDYEDKVYSQPFKDFFGDWENDPENASKVVDENGMPLVLHHGTNLSAVNKGNPFYVFKQGSHFGTQGQAEERINAGTGTDTKKIYNVYLNIRNPKRVSDVPKEWLEDEDLTHSEWWEKQIERAKYQGYDGLVYLNEYEDRENPADSWIAFYPEQIKSADENIGAYDRTNPDIRYRGIDLFDEGQAFPIHTTLGYSSYDVTGRRPMYSTELLLDEFPTLQSMLDAIRNQYPEYYATIEDGQLVMQSWSKVLTDALNAQVKSKGKESYINRKTRQAINAVEQLAKMMNLDVEVLTTTEGLSERNARSKGLFNRRTHKITIILPNHRTVSDVINTLMHEGVAHYGLRKMFGNHFATFLDNVYNNVDPEIKARIDASIKRNGWSRHEATEEYLARLAEQTDFEHAVDSGWWTKIKNFFLDMLAKAGFSTSLSDNELRYILWRSYDNLIHPNDRGNIFEKAREVQMESRLRVGSYAPDIRRTAEAAPITVAAEPVSEAEEYSDEYLMHSVRTKEPPKKTGIGYKVFVLKNGQLYPPMVANPNGEGTEVGVWLDADAAPIAGTSKTGRPQVKAGGKGTQGGSGQLAYRPGWHLGTIPYALQFNRKDANGEKTLFPNNFVWAEVEYANDVDYNDEARQEGINENGKYQHSLAGLKHVPIDGSYMYRTNPDPRTDPWIITGAMRVNKILSREEVNDLVRQAGREPQPIQDGDVLDQESVDALNAEIKAMKEADEMGLFMRRSDDDWDDEAGDLYVEPFEDNVDVARAMYEEAAASDALKFQESWQDKMAGLKILQNAIEKETGRKATGAEDAYLYENRMHGKAKNQSENYERRYYKPILKAADKMMKAKGWTDIRDLTNYMVAKHGLERNIFYAFKEAVTGMVRDEINKEQRRLAKDYEKGNIDALTYKKELKKLEEREAKDVADKIMEVHNDPEHIKMKEDYENGDITYADYITNEENLRRSYAPDFDEHYRDYSGLTELTGDETDYMTKALAMVEDAERDAQDEVTDLWDAVNAATKETLRFAYESGTMSRSTYNNVRAMFDYYIPLRGWEENNADDFYDYVSERNVFSTAIKKAYGRKSLAENPIAYIGNMAVSTLLAGHRNQLKQHFLNYVMNNPTSLVSVSEKWWENKGTETSPYWVEVAPEIPANATADEIADIVEAFNEEMEQKAAEGKATTRRGSLNIKYHATGAEKNEHMVEVQRAGKTYQLYINGNPKAAQALNGINEKAVSRISQTDFGKLIERINRNMAAFFTSKNPAFVLSNLSRDLTMAGASVAVKEDAAYNAQFIKNVVNVLRPRIGRASKYGFGNIATRLAGYGGRKPVGLTGLLPSLMRKYLDGDLDLTNETERLFGEFMDEGAETGFVNMLSVDSFKDKMQKEIARMQGTTLNIGKARNGTKELVVSKGLRLMGEIFEFYNRCAEDATRFIVYMTSRQMGKSLEDSIADAKDVTLNFNRKGTGAQWNAVVRDLFIFVNPAVQALANMFKIAYKHPLKMTAVTAAFVAGGALMPIINQWLLNLFGDDDDKDAYWNLPPWVRKNNLVMWVPGTKNFITIPLAQEFRVFYGLGEMASSLTYDHPVHQWPLEILSSFMDLVPINPTGNGGDLAVDLTPTMLQPLMQLHDNVDFTGKPIWKENQGNKYAPMYTKAYVSTPEWMVALSEGVNSITGGNEGKKGWIEENIYGGDYINNPAVWNHMFQGYFGGMYNTIAKTFDVGVTVATGNVPKVYQTPVLNRFLNRPVERDNAGVLGEEYYKLTEERDKTKYELRTWQKKAADGEEGAQEHVDEIMQSDDYQRMLVIDHYDKIMKDLKAGERAATQDIDKAEIKESITLYKAEMMEELADIDGGEDPLAAAKKKFDEAKTFSEKNRLRMRIEKLMQRDNKQKKRGDEVEKALSYREDDDRESRKVNEAYLELATAEAIEADARIRIAKQKIKQYTDEYKRLLASGAGDKANDYRRKYQKYFAADAVVQSQSRNMANNKKLLGKGHDAAIMKLIDLNRDQILKAIEDL